MLHIKVFGPGCWNCKRVEEIAQSAVNVLGEYARIEKVTAHADILKYPLLVTPGLVINEQLVCAGRIPAEQEVIHWVERERIALGMDKTH
jgi:small redox-active disulfide protein 2